MKEQFVFFTVLITVYFLYLQTYFRDDAFLTSYIEKTVGPPTTDDQSKPSYKLAYNQPDGFFYDIPDHNWKILQKVVYQTWPNHWETTRNYATILKEGKGIHGKWEQFEKSNWWNAENFQEDIHCQYAQRIPSNSNGDGPKWVCDPHRIAKQKSCLIYSVGSNGNVMFEKGIKEQISENCEIHTFDPKRQNKRNGHFVEALKGYATFHNWGLDVKTNEGKKMKTLQQTVKDLGHEGRHIDVLKMDCGKLREIIYHYYF